MLTSDVISWFNSYRTYCFLGRLLGILAPFVGAGLAFNAHYQIRKAVRLAPEHYSDKLVEDHNTGLIGILIIPFGLAAPLLLYFWILLCVHLFDDPLGGDIVVTLLREAAKPRMLGSFLFMKDGGMTIGPALLIVFCYLIFFAIMAGFPLMYDFDVYYGDLDKGVPREAARARFLASASIPIVVGMGGIGLYVLGGMVLYFLPSYEAAREYAQTICGMVR